MQKTEDITLKKTNIEIYFEEWKNEKNTKTIVILHGWGGSSQSWIKIGELLFQSGYNVIVPDLPGFGKTKLNKVFDLDEYATVVEKFLKELKINKIILWGHSNGGAISIKIANRGNIEIERLILNNSAGIRNNKKRSLKRKIFGKISFILKKFSKVPGFKKTRELLYRFTGGQDYLKAEKNPYLKQTYLNMIKSDLQEELSSIKQDTLLIRGEKDTYTPISDSKIFRSQIKKSKLIVLENEKHGIHLTSPIKLINTFIKNI